MNHSARLVPAILRSPVLWGGAAYAGFHALWSQGVIQSPFVLRYFAGHPVEYIETALFLIAAAALAIKAWDVYVERNHSDEPILPPAPAGGSHAADAGPLLARIQQLPRRQRRQVRTERLRKGLLHVERLGSAEKLDDELKYLTDMDADRAYASYGLVRMVIWAIPILGFLGTVIGIALAMGNLSPQSLETSLPAVMAGLMTAFDTTALALALSIVLFFAQFAVDRYEQKLLEKVDEQVAGELLGRFERVANTPDGQLASVRKSLQAVLESNEEIMQRQAEAWQGSIESVTEHWRQVVETSGDQLHRGLAAALDENVRTHAEQIVAAQQRTEAQQSENWRQLHDGLNQSVAAVGNLQDRMADQAEVLRQAVEATGEVTRLETELNRNLAALAGAKHFEQTVMSLAAAIHLLNARLGQEPNDAEQVILEPQRHKGQAA